MGAELTWIGHGSWQLKAGNHTILIDPFVDGSPTATMKSADLAADFILVSHGHEDHVADVAKIASRTGATVISNFEICSWLAMEKNDAQYPPVQNTIGMNLGGSANVPFGRVKLTLAFHSSQLPDGTYGGNPSGFLLTLLDGQKIYFACDTALFGDMKLIGAGGLDLAVLPIGDHFTMGPGDSIEAIKLLQPRKVTPSHYNTWPPIAQDVEKWAAQVRTETSAQPVVVPPGGSFFL